MANKFGSNMMKQNTISKNDGAIRTGMLPRYAVSVGSNKPPFINGIEMTKRFSRAITEPKRSISVSQRSELIASAAQLR